MGPRFSAGGINAQLGGDHFVVFIIVLEEYPLCTWIEVIVISPLLRLSLCGARLSDVPDFYSRVTLIEDDDR